MHRSSPTGVLAVALALLGCTSIADALTSATWVSGTGADTGACPITAPCKTFAYAHNQTSAGGSINVLSSGNFGPLTITKSISIVAEGVEALITSGSGSAAIIVEAGIVSLRGLTIDLHGSTFIGISFVSGVALHVHDSVIRKTTDGIKFQPASGTPELYVTDSVIADAGGSAGINVAPTGSAGAKVVLERVRVENGSSAGILFSGGFTSGSITAAVRDSVSAGSTSYGILANEFAPGTINVMVDRSASVSNFTGVGANGIGATILIGDSTVSGNSEGLSADNSGAIHSYGTNKVDGNVNDGAPTDTIPHT